MTETLADLRATEARLKADGWSEGNLNWWRRSAYADAGLAVPQPGPSTRSSVTAPKPPETGADWARRLTGKAEAAAPALGSLAARAIALGYGRKEDGAGKPLSRFIGVEER